MAFNLNQLLGLLQSNGNPEALLNQAAASNPTLQQAINMAKSGNPRDAAMNLAKTKGIPVEQVQQTAAQLGLNL